VMAGNVKQICAPLADDENVAGLWLGLEFPKSVEAGVGQDFASVDSAFDGAEAVIGDDKYVGLVAQIASIQFSEDRGDLVVGAFERGNGCRGTGSGGVLGVVRFAQPEQRIGRHVLRPKSFD